jgi:hypothetical protein
LLHTFQPHSSVLTTCLPLFPPYKFILPYSLQFTVSTHQETFSLCINWRRETTDRTFFPTPISVFWQFHILLYTDPINHFCFCPKKNFPPPTSCHQSYIVSQSVHNLYYLYNSSTVPQKKLCAKFHDFSTCTTITNTVTAIILLNQHKVYPYHHATFQPKTLNNTCYWPTLIGGQSIHHHFQTQIHSSLPVMYSPNRPTKPADVLCDI